MGRQHLRINRFGFAEYEDIGELSCRLNISDLAEGLGSIVDFVFLEESEFLDSMTDEAQANFVVPLGMSAKMLSSGEYSAMEFVSAACAVRFCAEPHMAEFPDELVRMLSRLPR
ncbi:hypothetical protein ABT256_19380 [Amycolatopsis japonica]|uniref:hypothetical protein n=1 Tax=Amycolatopsis japonica TaxID=208439 RepID=UPI003317B965